MRPTSQPCIGALLAILLLALVACSGEVEPATPPPSASPTTVETPTPVPPTSTPSPVPPTATPSPTPEPSWAPEDLRLPENLDSYRSMLRVAWTGTATDGEEAAGTMEITIESVREPLAEHVSIAGDYPQMQELGIPEDQTFDLYHLDGAVYTNLMAGWLRRPAQEGELAAFTTLPLVVSSELLKGLAHATYEGQELRNGVDTLHFSLDETSFQLADLEGAVIEKASGDIHVAVQGNYPVHLEMELSGVNLEIPADAAGKILRDGTVAVTFDLSSINEDLEVQVPDDALAAESVLAATPDASLLADIPLPEHAMDLTTSSLGLMTYESLRTPEILVLYYRDNMPKHGWHEIHVEQAAEVTGLMFKKDSRASSITISPDKFTGGTSVWITVKSE